MKHTNEGGQHSKPLTPALSLRDMTELLIKHYGIHEGKFNLLIEFQIGTGLSGPTHESLCPSTFVGVSKIGLMPTTSEAAITVDAAVVNPMKPKKPQKKKDDH
ncbi:MAG: hypothetical protein ACU85E_16780 [Gammaproteobacteria bacterium]